MARLQKVWQSISRELRMYGSLKELFFVVAIVATAGTWAYGMLSYQEPQLVGGLIAAAAWLAFTAKLVKPLVIKQMLYMLAFCIMMLVATALLSVVVNAARDSLRVGEAQSTVEATPADGGFYCDPLLCALSQMTEGTGDIVTLRLASESRIGGLTRDEYLSNSASLDSKLNAEVELWINDVRVVDFLGYPQKLMVTSSLYIVQIHQGYFIWHVQDAFQEIVPPYIVVYDVFQNKALLYSTESGYLFEDINGAWTDIRQLQRNYVYRYNQKGKICQLHYNGHPATEIVTRCGNDHPATVTKLDFAAYLHDWRFAVDGKSYLIFIGYQPIGNYVGDTLITNEGGLILYTIPEVAVVQQDEDMVIGVGPTAAHLEQSLFQLGSRGLVTPVDIGTAYPLQIVGVGSYFSDILVYDISDPDSPTGGTVKTIYVAKLDQ